MSLRLITIPISHYCEKARWALDRAGLVYREEPHAQIFHYIPCWWAGRSVTAPVLVHPDGVLTESSDIVRWVDAQQRAQPLYPAQQRERVEELERAFDERLGPSGRLWMYQQVLPHPEIFFRYGLPGVPAWEPPLVRLGYLAADRFLRWRLGVDAQASMESRDEVTRIFDEVARDLSDGRSYLLGDEFTAADLAFASLCAPVVLPATYGVTLPPLDVLPASYRLAVNAWREHPAGAFALRVYDEQRHAAASR